MSAAKRGRSDGGYFAGDRGSQQKYYGIKNQIAFRRAYPLRDYSYYPLQRGSESSLSMYGPSWKQATEQQRANRKSAMMTGKGLYRGRGGFWGGLLGSLIPGVGYAKGSDMGDHIYNMVGKTGDALKGVGQAIATARGRGLYRGRGVYAANNLVMDQGATASSVVPQFQPTDMHSITYSNREFVRDIFAPAASSVFEVQEWELNPGLPNSFPWLSQLAVNFEEYELVQLAYTFKSTVADFASNSGQVGQVLMATQYNPDSGSFATKDEMMLYEGGMSCKTTESLIHGIECDPKKVAGSTQKYVRVGTIPPTEDLKNYDLGKTSLAVINCPSTYANQQIGELWVSYTIVLRKPKIASGNAYNVRRDIFIAPPDYPITNQVAKQSTLLACARNSLGCEIYVPPSSVTYSFSGSNDNLEAATPTVLSNYAQVHQFTITIPSSYSGVLRLRCILTNNSQAILQQRRIIAVSEAPNTISRFADIPGMNTGTGAREWSHVLNTFKDEEQANQPRVSDLELHLRVQPPFQGVPNRIVFVLDGALDNAAIHTWTLEITQQNSFLSVVDNGKNDRIDLVQAFSGQPALYI